MTAIHIRSGHETDTAFIFDMLRQLAEHVGEAHEFTSTEADVRRDAFGPERRYETLIAEADGIPAGLVTWFFMYSTYKGARCLYINDLIVGAAARRLDVGRRLMAHAAGLARDHGCCRLDLRVHHDNPARTFYERLGMAQSNDVPYVISGEALDALAGATGEG